MLSRLASVSSRIAVDRSPLPLEGLRRREHLPRVGHSYLSAGLHARILLSSRGPGKPSREEPSSLGRSYRGIGSVEPAESLGTSTRGPVQCGRRGRWRRGAVTVTDEPTRFFIVHLQKTAGTSLRDRFRATFPDTAIYPNASDGRDKRVSVISVTHLLERWRERRDEIRLIAGHFPLSTIELLDADFVTLSILRAPVDRTLSYLRHQKKLNRDDRGTLPGSDLRRPVPLQRPHPQPHGPDVLHRSRRDGGGRRRAHRRRTTPGNGSSGPKTRLPASTGSGSSRASTSSGTTSRGRHGLEVGDPTRSNTTEPEPAPAALIERIEQDNALDQELFDYAEDLYRAQRRRHG